MQKEEILEKSKLENKKGDEKGLNDRNSSYAVGQIVGSVLCMILTVLEGSLFNRSATALWIVYVGISFTVALTGLIKSKKKWLLLPLIICGSGLIWLVTIYFIVRSISSR